MTIGIAWVGQRQRDAREHLYIAADSRTTGAYVFDACPKILTLPRSDCAICFAGVTSDPFLSAYDWYTWNKKYARFILRDWRQFPKPQTYASIQTYSQGVESDSTMPSIFVLGTWKYLGIDPSGEFMYRGQPTVLDSRTKKELPDPNTTFVVNADQVGFSQAYTSISKMKVEYTLILQRSTKRFHETFNFPANTQKNINDSGRCIQVHPFPKLPEIPEMSDEQKAEREKFEYCGDPPESDDFSDADRKAYCASPFIYQDEYLAAQQKTQSSGSKANK